MAAVSAQPRSAGSEAAPEPLLRCAPDRSAPGRQRRQPRGLPAGMGLSQRAGGEPDTHPHQTPAPFPFPPAELAGPLPPRAPPRPMGNSEAGARQHPNSATEACSPIPPPVGAALPRRRAAPSRPEPSPEPPAPLTGPAPAPTPGHPLAPGARL